MWFLGLLAGLAMAQDPALSETEIDKTPTQSFEFTLNQCDGVRGLVAAEGSDWHPGRVYVRLTNKTSETCSYHGVALKGFLADGSYRTQPETTDSTGLHIDPGTTFTVRINLATRVSHREEVKLEIAPGRGMIVLRGSPDIAP